VSAPPLRAVLSGGAAVELTATAEEAARLRADAAKGRAYLAQSTATTGLAREGDAVIRALCDEKDEMAAAIEAHVAGVAP
jgi:hypothetical protein